MKAVLKNYLPKQLESHIQPMSFSTLQRIARILSNAAGFIALLAIWGWMFDNSLLKRGIPTHPPMLLSSAVCWLLVSISLFVATSQSKSRVLRLIQKTLAVLVLFVGICAASDSGRVRAAVENAIANHLPYQAASIVYEPSIRGGITPILFAIALLCFQSRRPAAERTYQAMAILPMLIALLALIGHAYNIGAFYGASGLPLKTTVSFPAAVASILFGAALLAARPELATTQLLVSKTVGGYVARRLLLAPVLIPFATGFVHKVALKTTHYDPEIANWLFSFTNIFVFTVLIGAISFLLHRTDLKRQKAEETVRHLNENLENQIRIRTDELTQTNLRLTQEIDEHKKTSQQLLRAQRVECLGTLAGGIAHDLNNMLAPISMASALIESELATEDSRRYMEIISKSAQRGSDLIKQIMVFARGANGEMQKIDLSLLLRDLQKTMGAVLPQSIRLRVEYTPGLPPILADPTQVYQVLMNLCINARDAMPTGGTLQIDARPATAGPEKEERAVQIMVKDTGTGIPSAHLSTIFEPFFTTKEPGKGTGLGLATVKKIVEAHGGTIRVQSELGSGATFFVTFPVSLQDSHVQNVRSEDFQGGGERILVVEDEAALREILKATLEHAHFAVTTTPNGIEAIQAIQQSPKAFDLILTDFEMPFLSGNALVRELAKHLPLVPFVVMTGSLELSEGKGMDDITFTLLPKPFTTFELLRAVDEALRSPNRLTHIS